ncbi:putative quinol monooxygenase [Xanthobacter autotrophicus]|uniref:putative quinol monooxygenase n=1 Tax=Xanthobacter autotrophicus TaxID=280 RepID=UPI0037280401
MTQADAIDHVQLVGTLKARPGKVDALTALIKSIIPDVKKEPGSIAYSMYVDRNDQNVLVMLETWESASALEAHASAAPFRKLAASFGELLSEPPVLVTLRLLA